MELILLGGMSSQNKVWIKEVEAKLKALFLHTTVIEYSHWQHEGEEMNFENELEKTITMTKGKDYCIFAKSAGSLLSLKGIYEGKLTPRLCVFAGIAVSLARQKEYPIEKWLNGYQVPTLFFQKSDDPLCSVNELQSLIESMQAQHKILIEIPGDDHHYSDLQMIYEKVSDFISQ